MVSLARKNLFQEKTRLLISAGGVAFAVLLILVLQSLYQGWTSKMMAYLESIPAEIWVGQKGSSDLFHSISILPNKIIPTLEKINGVREVNKYLGRRMAFELKGNVANIALVGINTENGFLAPSKMKEGKKDVKSGEIIVDEVFAQNNEVGIGEKLILGGRNFKIVGISSGGNMVIYQFGYIILSDAQEIFDMKDTSNYFLLSLKDPSSQNRIQEEINSQVPAAAALPKTEVVDNSKKVVTESFLPIIVVLSVIGFLIGVGIIGLVIYTATVEKSREYGVLKAIGASPSNLYKIIFEQALIAGIMGYVLGVLLTLIATRFISSLVPEFLTYLRVIDLLWVFGSTILMSLFAAYIPIRRIVKIDPALVFKS